MLGLAEIDVRRLGQAFALERHDALVALDLRAAIDGHGEMALAEQLLARRERRHPLGREAGIATQRARHLIVRDEQVDRPVGRRPGG